MTDEEQPTTDAQICGAAAAQSDEISEQQDETAAEDAEIRALRESTE